MKNLRPWGIVTTAIIIFSLINCGGDDRAEQTRAVMKKNLTIMEEFIGSVETTEDPQMYLSALKKMKNDMEKLIPEMNELNKRYPEIFKLDENKQPSSELKNILKELVKKEAEIRPKFVAALQKVMKNAGTPEIKEELKKIFELQKKMTH